MNRKLIRLSQHHVTALRRHLKQGPRASFRPALSLGCRAVVLGLETPELARVHEQALVTLQLPPGNKGAIKRAEMFFTEANTAIEETHRAARQAKVHLNRLKETPGRRTIKLAASQWHGQHGIVQFQAREKVSEKIGRAHHKSLMESLQLQNRLRQLTHRAFVAQEGKRRQVGHKLQDEIVQTLVGINVRLLSLKQEARSNSQALKNAIASAQRLVVRSAKSVRRFARKLDTPRPIPGGRTRLTL